jgi:hypothetical protein
MVRREGNHSKWYLQNFYQVDDSLLTHPNKFVLLWRWSIISSELKRGKENTFAEVKKSFMRAAENGIEWRGKRKWLQHIVDMSVTEKPLTCKRLKNFLKKSVPNLFNKGNSRQTEETAHRIGENLCQLYIWQGTNTQNWQNSKKLNSQRINDPMKKWASELNRHFSKEYK